MTKTVATAIVHGLPPEVFVADDEETLHWILAIHLVANQDPETLSRQQRTELRRSLLEERWADAVVLWMEVNDTIVDFYSSTTLYEAADVELGPVELQFQRLFRSAED
jgi:hypothetical protein